MILADAVYLHIKGCNCHATGKAAQPADIKANYNGPIVIVKKMKFSSQ